MNVKRFINDPMLQSNLLKGDSFQTFITDEYAIAYLLTDSSFPKGLKVYGPLAASSNHFLSSEETAVSSTNAEYKKISQDLTTTSFSPQSVSAIPNSTLPIGVTYIKDTQKENLQQSSFSDVTYATRYGSGPMTREQAIKYLALLESYYQLINKLLHIRL